MSWTKRQFVEAAFARIGLASYVFDLQPAQLQSAAVTLDMMMAGWNALGIRVGYPISSGPSTVDLDTATGVPDMAVEAIAYNLGVRLAPDFGKTVSPDVKMIAHRAYNTLMARCASIIERQLPGSLPAGAGHKGETLTAPTDELQVGPDDTLDFE